MTNDARKQFRPFVIRHSSFVIGFLVLASLFVSPARAQMLSVDLSSDEAFVGEALIASVTVSNPSQATAPSPPISQDFDIRLMSIQPSMNQRVTIVNGRMNKQVDYTFQFSVKPLRPGRLILGRFTLKDRGRSFNSQPIPISVSAQTGTQYLFCEITAKRDVAYIGQPVVLTYEIWVRRFHQPGIGMLDASNTWGLKDMQASAWGVFSQADIGQPKYASQQREVEQGHSDDFFVYYLETTAYPTKAGPFDFGNIEFVYNYPVRIGRNVFNWTLERSRRLSVRPKLPSLRVESIPQEGRPPDYSGAIGVYTIFATAKPTKVPVGDPITLTIAIRGDGSLDRLSAPRLDQVAALTRDFEVSADVPAGSIEGDRKLFSVTIRALREDIKQIPSIPLSFFNPESGAFETAHSTPIPISVMPAPRIALSNLPAMERGAEDSGIVAPLIESSEGLFPNEPNPDVLLADQSASLGPGEWSLLAIMPLAYTATSILCARSARFRRDHAFRRRSRALSTAKKALAAIGQVSPSQLRAIVVGYIADCCNAPAGGLTRADAVKLLADRAVSPDAIRDADALLEQLELAEYAGAGGDAGGADPAWRLIQTLEQEKLR